MSRGSIRERSPGRWQIRAYVADNRWATETVRGTEKDAERRLRKLLDEIDEGSHRGPDRTLAQLLDAWLDARGPALSPSTLVMTRSHLENYLRPRLGRVRLSRLEPARIDAFYGELLRQGVSGRPLSPGYVHRIHGTLHLALEQAVSWGWLTRNPAARASPPVAGMAEIDPPTAAEVRRLLAASESNPMLCAFLRLAAAAGPRRGEIAGLRRSDISWSSGTVTFRRVVVRGPGGVWVVKPGTKTGKSRQIALDPGTVTALVVHIETLEKQAALFGTTLIDDPWLFSTSIRGDETPRPTSFTQAFMRLRNRLGLSVRLHDLRHAHATQLLTAGVDVRTVAGRLGHSNASTTLNIYAGFVPAADRAAADLVGGFLSTPDI